MTNLPVYVDLIYSLASVATEQLGQTYSLYRSNPTSTGSIVAGPSLITKSFGMYFEKASKKNIENTTFDLQVEEAIGDASLLRIGDFLVENGRGSDGGTYCVAQIRYRKPFRTILVRVDSRSAIERPHPDTGAAEEQPVSGSVYHADLYGGLRPTGRFELTLDNGSYLVLPQGQGTLASIPIGFQPQNRASGSHKPNLPTQIAVTRYLAYIPPSSGYIPQELDVLKGQAQDSYSVVLVYSSNNVGLAGTVCLVEKLPS